MKSDFMKKLILAIIVFGLSHAGLVFSAEETTDEETANGGDESDLPQGILPIPAYGDDIAARDFLIGDPSGKRTEAANHGFQWDIDTVTWADKVFDGGINDDLEFGGSLGVFHTTASGVLKMLHLRFEELQPL
jgi:hypothetical protein